MTFSWKQWKMGALIAIGLGLLSAGAGLAGNMNWTAFVAVCCVSITTHFAAFLSQHPIESIVTTVRETTVTQTTSVKTAPPAGPEPTEKGATQ
jgi:hypothetical protein